MMKCPKCGSLEYTTGKTIDINYIHRPGRPVRRQLDSIAGYPWFFKCDSCGFEDELTAELELLMEAKVPVYPKSGIQRSYDLCACGNFKSKGLPHCGKCHSKRSNNRSISR